MPFYGEHMIHYTLFPISMISNPLEIGGVIGSGLLIILINKRELITNSRASLKGHDFGILMDSRCILGIAVNRLVT